MSSFGSLVAIVTFVPFVAACGVHPLVDAGVLVGGAVLAEQLSDSSADSGPLNVRLPDGRVLEGTWSQIVRLQDAEGISVITPGGPLTAAELVDPEVPVVAGAVRHPTKRMICAFVGDPYSGYEACCADDAGTRWHGDRYARAGWTPGWSWGGRPDPYGRFVSGFRGGVTVVLRPGRN